MKKNSIMKAIATTTALLAVSAMAIPTTVSAFDTNIINKAPAFVLESSGVTAEITLNKDIVLFNVDEKTIFEPNVTYTYAISEASVTDATITTYDPNDLEDGSPKTGAVPQKVTVKKGVLAAISTSVGDKEATTDAVEGTITFGAGSGVPHTAADLLASNKEPLTDTDEINTDLKATKNLKIRVDASVIYDDGAGAPGVYRYKISDITEASELTAAGVKDGGAAADLYLDVYTRFNTAKNGLEIYGYVLLTADSGSGDNTSIEYKNTATVGNKVTGYDTDSETVDENGDHKVQSDDLKSDSYHTYNLEVKKTVDGTLGDKNHEFPFQINLSNAAVTHNADFYWTQTDAAGNTITHLADAATGTGDELVLGALSDSSAIKLKDGDTCTIYGVPADTKVLVSEYNDSGSTYSVAAKQNGDALALNKTKAEDKTSAAMSENKDIAQKTSKDEIEFTNTLNDISVTGLFFNIAPFAFIAAAGAALLGLLMKNKKRGENESRI